MKINEVERLVGITKGNIRFYEKEGLLTPGRNSENGYRDYSEADVIWLKKIKLLRMLDVPIEEILRLKAGSLTLTDAMGRHMIQLERRQANLEAMHALCAELRDSRGTLDGLDADGVLERIRRQEQEGARFVDVKKRDHRGEISGRRLGRVGHAGDDGRAHGPHSLGIYRIPGGGAAPGADCGAGRHPGGGHSGRADGPVPKDQANQRRGRR